jgi:hypothetical protein
VEHTKVLILGQGTRVEKAVELITSKVKRDENKVILFFFLSMLVSWEALSSFPFPEKKDSGCQNGRNKEKSSY